MSSEGNLSITDSFSKLMLSDLTEPIANIAEAGLDSILEDGFLKDVPFLSSAIAVFKFGSKVKFAHEIKKLANFITALNQNEIDKDKIRKYRDKKTNDKKAFMRELEHLLIILEKYLEYEKPKLLAKLYIAYIDNRINWEVFCAYSIVIERIVIYDIVVLMQFKDKEELKKVEMKNIAAILRLSSLGLIEVTFRHYFWSIGEDVVLITEFGRQFIDNI